MNSGDVARAIDAAISIAVSLDLPTDDATRQIDPEAIALVDATKLQLANRDRANRPQSGNVKTD